VEPKRRNNSVKNQWVIQGYQRDQNDEVSSYKIKQTWSGATRMKGAMGGNNTKEVVEYIKKPWTLFRNRI
jgi:hypothetical protein